MEKPIKCRGLILKQLPAKIVEEILYNLPVKSLLRFECVSKSWLSSISSKGFIREHLKKSNSGTDYTHHNIIFTYYISYTGSCCIGYLLNDDDDDGDEPNPNCLHSNLSTPKPIPASENHNSKVFATELLGSCNGLILIRLNLWELYLWNPSTRKAKYILNASFPQECRESRTYPYRVTYGLGYVESTDDYKVVFLQQNPTQIMYMYSSRTDSWKKIPNFYKGSLAIANCPVKFVNGRLHWLTKELWPEIGGTIYQHIVSLDLVEEKHQLIVPPPYCFSSYGDTFGAVVTDLGGYLSFICYNYGDSIMDVWVMTKYGEKDSWSKIWNFSEDKGRFPEPLWLKKNGDIVAALGSGLVVYRGGYKLRQSRVHDMLNCEFESIVYVETLVSPFGDDE